MKDSKTNIYVQYGCGLCAPKEWVNFDVSPTLRKKNSYSWNSFEKKNEH